MTSRPPDINVVHGRFATPNCILLRPSKNPRRRDRIVGLPDLQPGEVPHEASRRCEREAAPSAHLGRSSRWPSMAPARAIDPDPASRPEQRRSATPFSRRNQDQVSVEIRRSQRDLHRRVAGDVEGEGKVAIAPGFGEVESSSPTKPWAMAGPASAQASQAARAPSEPLRPCPTSSQPSPRAPLPRVEQHAQRRDRQALHRTQPQVRHLHQGHRLRRRDARPGEERLRQQRDEQQKNVSADRPIVRHRNPRATFPSGPARPMPRRQRR